MNWWRAHNGISSDSKLAAIALRAKAKRAEVLAVWICLLDFASQNNKRGNINGLNAEDIAAQLELSEDLVQRILGAMQTRGMVLPDGMIAAWEERNPSKTDDTNAERQRRYRETHRDVTTVTPQSNGVTALRNPEEKRREEKREEVRARDISPTATSNGLAKTNGTHAPALPANGIDWSERYAAVYALYPLPGFCSEGQMRYLEIVGASVNPETAAAAIDRSVIEYAAFWRANPGEYVPGIGKFFEDGYYLRAPEVKRQAPARAETPTDQAIRFAKEKRAKERAHG